MGKSMDLYENIKSELTLDEMKELMLLLICMFLSKTKDEDD